MDAPGGHDERGFALTELLVAMTVGLIVLLAAFLLLDRAHSASREISDRQDAVQRGRQATEYLTRQIRSQVCLGNTTEPITHGSADQVTFYADLSDGRSGGYVREQRYNGLGAGSPSSCGNAWVSGTYNSDLTIGADNDVIVENDLIRGNDGVLLGLIANNFVRVYHPVDHDLNEVNGCANT